MKRNDVGFYLEWTIMLHVFLEVEDSLPDGEGFLGLSLVVTEWGGVVLVWVLEIISETSDLLSSKNHHSWLLSAKL